jgi:hypothetical protein
MALLDGLRIVATLAVALTVGEGAGLAAAPADAIPGTARPTAATAASSSGGTAKPGSAISLQGGWWSLEAEGRARFGLYGAVGIPWVAVPLAMLNGATWAAPLGARVGYQYSLSARCPSMAFACRTIRSRRRDRSRSRRRTSGTPGAGERPRGPDSFDRSPCHRRRARRSALAVLPLRLSDSK